MTELKPILLVEDSKKDIELTLEALALYNLANRVDVVRDGEEALDFLFHRRKYQDLSEGLPVVVLLDLKMPKVDGITVLKEIKTNDRLKSIPVVVLTSSREDFDLETCYKLGANAYVVKPVKFSEFVDAVQKLGVFWALVNEPPLGSRKIEN
jgi:CheY-like chemotaxis protein